MRPPECTKTDHFDITAPSPDITRVTSSLKLNPGYAPA